MSTAGASALKWTTRTCAMPSCGMGSSVRTCASMLSSMLVAATVVMVPAPKSRSTGTDDGAVGRVSASCHDLDGVGATGNLEVLGKHAEGHIGQDGATVGVDVDGRSVRAEVPDADLGGFLVLREGAGRESHDRGEGGGGADDLDLVRSHVSFLPFDVLGGWLGWRASGSPVVVALERSTPVPVGPSGAPPLCHLVDLLRVGYRGLRVDGLST